MGGGSFNDNDYHAGRAQRAANNIQDFAYTNNATQVHPILNTKRILDKPYRKLESRDSEEHPISTPIIVTFDVTGSNIRNAKIAQQRLPELMSKLTEVCENPQLAIWANDDTRVVGVNAIQMSDFESDNRIDDAIRHIWLTGNGGGNGGESYDLLLYAAARKTITDSFQKRSKKGVMILYADEYFFPSVRKVDVMNIFSDVIEADIPIGDIVAEAKKTWDIYVIWPVSGYEKNAIYSQYEELFDIDHVIPLLSPDDLCDKIAEIVKNRTRAEVSSYDADYVDRVV